LEAQARYEKQTDPGLTARVHALEQKVAVLTAENQALVRAHEDAGKKYLGAVRALEAKLDAALQNRPAGLRGAAGRASPDLEHRRDNRRADTLNGDVDRQGAGIRAHTHPAKYQTMPL